MEYTGTATGIWITLEQAENEGLRLAYVRSGIGPRRAGVLYRGGYGDTVNNVIAVHVRVGETTTGDGRRIRIADHWEVTERSDGEDRVRRHCTSWTFEPRNTVLHGPADTRL